MVLAGESSGDSFGRLSGSARLDLNGDRIDDLIVGAPMATVYTATNLTPSVPPSPNDPTVAAGRVYTIFGRPTSATPAGVSDTFLAT